MAQKIPSAVLDSDLTIAFLICIIGLFTYSVIKLLFSKNSKSRSYFNAVPALLTSIGVLGTFTGIFIGLVGFDVHDINRSVPHLLDGLKVAFSTSIAGIALSIIFKLLMSALTSTKTGGAGVEDLLSELDGIKTSIDDFKMENAESLLSLNKVIAGEGDSSVVTQVQKLRTTIADEGDDTRKLLRKGFDEQINEFIKFAEKMADNNSKALIEALNNLIEEFNKKIHKEFGENLRRLNEGVGAMLEWQQNNKDQIELLTTEFKMASEGIVTSNVALDNIRASAESIPTAMDSLVLIINTFQAQTEELNRHLEAFSHLSDSANDAFPIIEKNLIELTDEFSTANKSMIKSIEEVLDYNNESHKALGDGFKALEEKTELLTDSLSKELETVSIKLAEKISSAVDQHSDSIIQSSRKMETAFTEAIHNTTESLGGQIEHLDKEMQEEVKRVVEKMGSALASLSSKFVHDYEPLTEKLKDLISSIDRV